MEKTKKIESESTSVNQIFDIPKIKTQEEDHREKMKAKSESLNKGLALDRLGEYQEAITAFDNALKIDPQYKLALDNKEIAIKKLHPVGYS
jgi:tetratricopeptide (TPR) repeat protein